MQVGSLTEQADEQMMYVAGCRLPLHSTICMAQQLQIISCGLDTNASR